MTPDAPEVAVFGAAGYAGALSARLLHRHPHFMLTTVTARSDVGRRLDALYPHHRVPLVLEELEAAQAMRSRSSRSIFDLPSRSECRDRETRPR